MTSSAFTFCKPQPSSLSRAPFILQNGNSVPLNGNSHRSLPSSRQPLFYTPIVIHVTTLVLHRRGMGPPSICPLRPVLCCIVLSNHVHKLCKEITMWGTWVAQSAQVRITALCDQAMRQTQQWPWNLLKILSPSTPLPGPHPALAHRHFLSLSLK